MGGRPGSNGNVLAALSSALSGDDYIWRGKKKYVEVVPSRL